MFHGDPQGLPYATAGGLLPAGVTGTRAFFPASPHSSLPA